MFKRIISLCVSICMFCSVMPTSYAGTNSLDVFKDTKNVLAPTNVNNIILPKVVTTEALLSRATTDSKSGILKENLLLAMQYKINPAIFKGVFTSRAIIDYDLTQSSPKITVSQFNAVDQVSYTFYKEQISKEMLSKGFNTQYRITTTFKNNGEKVYTYESSVLLKEENLKITNAEEFYKYQIYSKESLEPQLYYVIDQTLDSLYLPNSRNLTMASGLPLYDMNKMFNATKSLPNGMLSANSEYKNATPVYNKLFLYSYLKKMPTYYRFTRDFIEFSDGSKYVVLIDDTKKANGNPANTYAYFNIESGVEITDPNALTLLAKYYAMINSRPNFEKYYVKDFNLNYFTLLASMKASANATALATGITKALKAVKTGKKLAVASLFTKVEGKGKKEFNELFTDYLNFAVIVLHNC